MKKLIITALVSVFLLTSCSVPTDEKVVFPTWLQGEWHDERLDKTLIFHEDKMYCIGDDFATEYMLKGYSLNVYETADTKIAEFITDPFLYPTARMNKKTGVLEVEDYKRIIEGSYTND